MIEISKKLLELISKCDSLEELPHSFDDTLMDKLLNQICLENDVFLSFFDDLIDSTRLCESSSVNVSLIIRLVEKFCTDQRFAYEKLVYFISECEKLFDQDRPPRVFYDLFHFNTTVFPRIENEQLWKPTISWSMGSLKNANLSIFVLRELGAFLNKFSPISARAFVCDLILIFCNADSVHVRNCVASLITPCVADVSVEERNRVLEVVQTSTGLGDSSFILAAHIILLDRPDYLFDTIGWNSEFACIEVSVKYMKINDKLELSWVRNFMKKLSQSNNCNLGHFVAILSYLEDEVPGMTRNYFEEWFSIVSPKLHDRKFARLKELNSVLSVLMDTRDEDDTFRMLESFLERLRESPSYMHEVHQRYGDSCLKHHKSVCSYLKNFISNALADNSEDCWDVRDTAIEIAYLFPNLIENISCLPPLLKDSSPYIRAAVLRFLIKIKYESDVIIEAVEEILTSDVDPEPRIEASRYLVSKMPSHLTIASNVYHSLLEDSDIDLRRLGLDLASFLLKNEQFGLPVRHDLEEWVEDVQIGERIRELLGTRVDTPTEDPTLHLLASMLSALDVTDDDTIDCY